MKGSILQSITNFTSSRKLQRRPTQNLTLGSPSLPPPEPIVPVPHFLSRFHLLVLHPTAFTLLPHPSTTSSQPDSILTSPFHQHRVRWHCCIRSSMKSWRRISKRKCWCSSNWHLTSSKAKHMQLGLRLNLLVLVQVPSEGRQMPSMNCCRM